MSRQKRRSIAGSTDSVLTSGAIIAHTIVRIGGSADGAVANGQTLQRRRKTLSETVEGEMGRKRVKKLEEVKRVCMRMKWT